jgi:phage tail sheath gpL-like
VPVPTETIGLITQGGAIVVLAFGIGAFLTGRIRSKPAHDAEVDVWKGRLDDAKAECAEWKALAKASVDQNGVLSAAIERGNRRMAQIVAELSRRGIHLERQDEPE